MYLIGVFLWTLIAGVLAWVFAYLLTRRAKASWPRWLMGLILLPLILVAPLGDEIIGKSEFDHLQWEPPTITHLQLAIPIRQYEHQILDARSGKVVAQWRSYGTSGGWLSQHFETPFLVRSTCSPQVVRDSQIERKLLHFNSPRGIR